MITDQTTHRQPTGTPSPATRWALPAAFALGGVLLALAVVLHALEPVGCVGELQCASRSMRAPTALTAVTGAAALALIMLAFAGIVLLGRAAGRLSSLGVAGASCMLAGGGGLVAATLAQELVQGRDLSWMPWLVLPSMIGVIVGIVLIAAWTVRSGVLRPWLGALLAASGASLLAVNEQTAMVLLALPLAATMILVGAALAGRRPR